MNTQEQKQIGKIKIIVCNDKEEVAKKSAEIFAKAIREKANINLGLATGGTPVGMYKELIRMHKEEKLDFSRVKSFNLDEYVGIDPDNNQSYRCFMNTNLFDQVNINKQETYVPLGKGEDLEKTCREYEKDIKAAAGIDLQLLGIGSNGHIAFNEPGSPGDSRTRVVDLTQRTIKDNTRFFEKESEVPRQAVTMGIGTILEAKKIILLATGSNKAEAVAKAIKGAVSVDIPASFLQQHANSIFIIDKDAAANL